LSGEKGKAGRIGERERKTYALYEYLQYPSFLPTPPSYYPWYHTSTIPQSTNQPINQSTGSIPSPQYSNMMLVSRPHFFPLTNTVQAKNTCMRTYYTSSHPPSKATVSHRSGHNTVHQPTQPTNHCVIISLPRRRATLLACRQYPIPPQKGENKNDNGRSVAAGGFRWQKEEEEGRGKKTPSLTHCTRHIHTWTQCMHICTICISTTVMYNPNLQPRFDIHDELDLENGNSHHAFL